MNDRQDNCVAAMVAAFEHAAERRGSRPEAWDEYLRLREPQMRASSPEWSECLLREALGMAAGWVAGGLSRPANRRTGDTADLAAHELDGKIWQAWWGLWGMLHQSEIHWQEHMLCQYKIARWSDAPPIWERKHH